MTPEFIAAIIGSVMSGGVLFLLQGVRGSNQRIEAQLSEIRESMAAEKQIRLEHERRLTRLEGRIDQIERDISTAIAR